MATTKAAGSARPVPRARDSSVELGSPPSKPRYNKHTGRPIRRTAGQKQIIAGFVDSAVIEEDFEPIELPSENEDGEQIKASRTKKRKRSPSPTPPPLESFLYDEGMGEDTENEDIEMAQAESALSTPVHLQFNVPLGFHGPLMVKLDKSVLHSTEVQNLQPRISKIRPDSDLKPASYTSDVGFVDLPPEIRNKVYRLLFVTDSELSFRNPTNFCRSAQFLRSCRLVHSEGCSILYGENKFAFWRIRGTRAPFWEPNPKEIGYKDVRQFLKMIGPENLVYLREIKLVFDDASPSCTPDLSHEQRRYLNDEQLLDCLRILRQAKLRKVVFTFLGRRSLLPTDSRFLGYLERIKADEVTTHQTHQYYSQKIWAGVFEDLKKVMTRKQRLYVKE